MSTVDYAVCSMEEISRQLVDIITVFYKEKLNEKVIGLNNVFRNATESIFEQKKCKRKSDKSSKLWFNRNCRENLYHTARKLNN